LNQHPKFPFTLSCHPLVNLNHSGCTLSKLTAVELRVAQEGLVPWVNLETTLILVELSIEVLLDDSSVDGISEKTYENVEYDL